MKARFSLCFFLVSIVAGASRPINDQWFLEKRVFTTNDLNGFKKDFPSIWPPGLGGEGASERVIVDVGANNGDTYTLVGYKKGHTVFAFEPSPMVNTLFRGVMRKNNVDVALIKLRSNILGDKGLLRARQTVKIPRGAPSINPKVYLLPFALSNFTGVSRFHESPCKNLEKCGKVNHIISAASKKTSRMQVPTFRLDDFSLPLGNRTVWLLKIDVEGHELEVLQGARKFLKETEVPYLAIEFSSNGSTGTEWGMSLLEEIHSHGYACFHLRGFGKCHDSRLRSPSLKCNYPFSTTRSRKAPTFKEYTKVFITQPGREMQRRRMADLMCVHRKILEETKNPSKL